MMMKDNLFLLIEDYLAHPSAQARKRIKQASGAIALAVLQDLNDKYPGKPLGGDDTMTTMLAIIQQSAEAAYNCSLSSRLISNNSAITETDPAYIFRLTKAQQEDLSKLKAEFLREARHLADPFVFAYGCYIERYHSTFDYCQGIEALVRDENAKLALKARILHAQGYKEAASVLFLTHQKIAEHVKLLPGLAQETRVIKSIERILEDVKQSPLLKEHHAAREVLYNFILLLSGFGLLYLAATQHQRQSFWYWPNDADTKVNEFKDRLKGISP